MTSDTWHMTPDMWNLTCDIWGGRAFCKNFSFLVPRVGNFFFKASALWADAFYKSKCPSVCPNVRLYVCPSVCLFTFEVLFKRLFAPTSRSRMSNIFKASALWADAFYKSKCPSVRVSVCPSVCPSVCLFTFEVLFNGHFAPTSRSRMSNMFRDSESLGKSNGKK